LENVKQSWEDDSIIQDLISKLRNGEAVPKYSYSQGLLYRKGKLVVGKGVGSHTKIIQFFLASALGGHYGVVITTKRIACLFWWKGLSKEARNFVREGLVCQKHKADLSAPRGLLQPLLIPGAIWVDVSMDFIEGLSTSRGRDTIMVVVACMKKQCIFSPTDTCVFFKK